MPPPTKLSYDEILKFMLEHNGKVTNHELVKHFKVFLMNPDKRDEARSTFKKHVNTLAIIKNQNNEKWLILKKKYMTSNGKEQEVVLETKEPPVSADLSGSAQDSESSQSVPPPRPPLPLQLNQDFSILNNLIQDSHAQTPHTPETPANYDLSLSVSKESLLSVQSDDVPPKVHPRRKSSDKRSSIPSTPRSSIPNQDMSELDESTASTLTTSQSETMLVDSEQTISVKERKQMFNRMASESDVLKSKPNTSLGSQGADEEDRVSLDQKSEDPLDTKQKQWILCAAKGEYHALAKMCKENAKLVKTKDPFTTAMHWACKRGDENLVKLLGGVARHVVNERSGYTPLHIAMQFRHEHVYRLLIEVYDADPNVRDWSGRKPRQYLVHMDTSLSPGSYRKADTYDLRRTVTSSPAIRITSSPISPQSKADTYDLRRTVTSSPAIRITSSPISPQSKADTYDLRRTVTSSPAIRITSSPISPQSKADTYDLRRTVTSSPAIRITSSPISPQSKADTYDLRRTVTSSPAIRITSSPISPQSKKEGFLRIGSLNVRVKKTTEAFSNFLGVGATRSSSYLPKSARDRDDRRSEDYDQLHKTWGSADNIQKEDKLMPPPMNSKVRRRGASGRRGLGAAHSRSTPSTPDQPRAQMGVNEEGDSDSDSAAGFHSAWRQQRASHCT